MTIYSDEGVLIRFIVTSLVTLALVYYSDYVLIENPLLVCGYVALGCISLFITFKCLAVIAVCLYVNHNRLCQSRTELVASYRNQ